MMLALFSCDASNQNKLDLLPIAISSKQNDVITVDAYTEGEGTPSNANMDVDMPALLISLSIDERELNLGQVVVVAEVKNISSETIRLFTYNTPIDSSVLGRIFDVRYGSKNDQKLTYVGLMAKRLPPTPEDYVEILPDQIASGTFNITSSYKFCGNTRYLITFTRGLYDDSEVPVVYSATPVWLNPIGSLPNC